MTISRRQFLGSAAALGAAELSLSRAAKAASPETPPVWNEEADVLVAGGGAAGCMAALEAAKAGRRVLLVQSMPMIGGNSAISSGWIRSACTRWHEAHGVADTPEDYAADMLAYGQGSRDEAKAGVIARGSRDFVNTLLDLGVRFLDEEDRVNGGEKLRILKTEGRGAALMAKLNSALRALPNVKIVLQTKLVDVVLDAERKAVTGALIERRGRRTAVKTPAVVIATGGYGRRQDMIERFTNTWRKTARIMDTGAQGDGLRIATELGAGSANLNIAMILPTFETTTKQFTSTAPILKGSIFVNEEGRRFTNEYAVYYQADIDMLAQKKVWEVMSEDLDPSVAKMAAAGQAVRCETLEDLARLIGCPVEGLRADIGEHNALTRMPAEKRRDRFGRTAYAKELHAPFFAMTIEPVMIETVGGILINERAEVTTLLGRPIARGLYAAGAVAFGEHFGVGYRSGDAYVYAGVMGMVAGREAAKL